MPAEAPFEALVAQIETPQTFPRPAVAAKMMDEYLAGATRESLASKYGVSRSTVRNHARRLRKACSEGVTDEVLADFASGIPVKVLADRHSLMPETILRQARLAGVQFRPRNGNQLPAT